MQEKLKALLREKSNTIKLLMNFLFLIYSLIMFWQVFLGPYRSYSNSRRYNIYPFKTIIDYISNTGDYSFEAIFINLAANIITFIPLGFFIAFTSRKSFSLKKSLLICISIIIYIELGQYIFNVGVLDIDDLILNFLGALSGVLLYNSLMSLANFNVEDRL